MSAHLRLLHVAAGAAWLGCVLVEVVFERQLAGHDAAGRLRLAQLHWQVDLMVELPSMVLLLACGALLWPQAAPGPALTAMLLAGGLAWLANALCVGLVWQRLQCARRGDATGYARADRWQHRVGALVLLGLLGALGAGLLR